MDDKNGEGGGGLGTPGLVRCLPQPESSHDACRAYHIDGGKDAHHCYSVSLCVHRLLSGWSESSSPLRLVVGYEESCFKELTPDM